MFFNSHIIFRLIWLHLPGLLSCRFIQLKSEMGQIIDKLIGSMSTPEERVPYEEESNDGFIFCDKYIPEEVLPDILCYCVDYKSLCSCQLVCKNWQNLIQDYLWRKKAELTVHHALPADENAPWTMYYLICHKKPFYKNLMKNHSGEIKLKKDTNWVIKSEGGDGWKIGWKISTSWCTTITCKSNI